MRTGSLNRVVSAGGLAIVLATSACGSPHQNIVGPSLTVSGVFPNSGSTFGFAEVSIAGTGFAAGDVVRIDGTVTPSALQSPSRIIVTTPPHAAGAVDITVTDALGTSATLSKGFEYRVIDPPIITSILPAAGVPDAGNTVTIVGTGFQPLTRVTFDGVEAKPVDYGPLRTSTSLPAYPPKHVVGLVEVVVKNPDGQSQRIPAGYTYAPSETFDFNGTWNGFAWETGATVSFTIESNVVVRVTCGAVSNYTFSSPPVVSGGTFSVRTADGMMTGRILSPTEAAGELQIPGCLSDWGWSAAK